MKPAPPRKSAIQSDAPAWTFLSNHAHVLICLAQEPALRIQDLADRVNITYRAVQRILDDLESAGYISRSRQKEDGRSNEYCVDMSLPLRHPIEMHRPVSDLVKLVCTKGVGARSRR